MKLITAFRSMAFTLLACFSLSGSAAVISMNQDTSLSPVATENSMTSNFNSQTNLEMDGKMWMLLILAFGLFCANKIVSVNPEHREFHFEGQNDSSDKK